MKNKRIKRWLPIISAALITVLCASPVYAGNENIPLPDDLRGIREEERGSIGIELTDGGVGTSKEGVVFEYAKVADVVDGEYRLLDAYKGSGVDLNSIERAEQMDEAAIQLGRYQIPDGRCQTDEDGKASIRDLGAGVYLLHVSEQARYDEVTPVLVAIPTWGEKEGDMLYDVKVIPKHTPVPPGKIITETPPGERGGVKTGDMHTAHVWAGLLAGAAATGAVVSDRYRKRKVHYEEH